MELWDYYYPFVSIGRMGCGIAIAWLFLKHLVDEGSMTTNALGLFFGAYAFSVAIFFGREFLPPELEEVLRDLGVGLQLAAVSALLWALKRRRI